MERKVKGGAVIGLPLAVIIAWLWNSSFPDNQMPTGVEAALGSLLTVAAAWLVPNR